MIFFHLFIFFVIKNMQLRWLMRDTVLSFIQRDNIRQALYFLAKITVVK